MFPPLITFCVFFTRFVDSCWCRKSVLQIALTITILIKIFNKLHLGFCVINKNITFLHFSFIETGGEDLQLDNAYCSPAQFAIPFEWKICSDTECSNYFLVSHSILLLSASVCGPTNFCWCLVVFLFLFFCQFFLFVFSVARTHTLEHKHWAKPQENCLKWRCVCIKTNWNGKMLCIFYFVNKYQIEAFGFWQIYNA